MFLDYDALARTPLQTEPYDWLMVPRFIRPEVFSEIIADYPTVPGGGSHPPAVLDIHGKFAALMQELDGPRFRGLVEEKLGLDLENRPTMYTVRGFCRQKDGGIHTDSATKIVTVLLYMNQAWDTAGGRLRILRNGTDLNDYVAEVPPDNGTLLIFRRSENSWHGHEKFDGPRRVVQMNWVTGAEVVAREQGKHRATSRLKRLLSFGRGY